MRNVDVGPLAITATTVTNAEFAAFVEATGRVTDAERYGWSFVFGGLLPDDFPDTRGVQMAPWWRQVYEADWRRPEGPQSSIEDRPTTPSSRSRGTTPWPTPSGPAADCPPSRSGSSPPGAAWTSSPSPGATSWSRAGSTA